MLATAISTGPCLAMTTIVLVVGLSVLTLAQIKSIVWLGVLLPVAMVAALITDLTLLPTLTLMFTRRRDQSPNRPPQASLANQTLTSTLQLEHSHDR